MVPTNLTYHYKWEWKKKCFRSQSDVGEKRTCFVPSPNECALLWYFFFFILDVLPISIWFQRLENWKKGSPLLTCVKCITRFCSTKNSMVEDVMTCQVEKENLKETTLHGPRTTKDSTKAMKKKTRTYGKTRHSCTYFHSGETILKRAAVGTSISINFTIISSYFRPSLTF